VDFPVLRIEYAQVTDRKDFLAASRIPLRGKTLRRGNSRPAAAALSLLFVDISLQRSAKAEKCK
jgi:hypothetical protein